MRKVRDEKKLWKEWKQENENVESIIDLWDTTISVGRRS